LGFRGLVHGEGCAVNDEVDVLNVTGVRAREMKYEMNKFERVKFDAVVGGLHPLLGGVPKSPDAGAFEIALHSVAKACVLG